MVAPHGRVIKPSGRQIGKTYKPEDERKTAMKPGRRISKNERPYTENRRNRSDISPKKRL